MLSLTYYAQNYAGIIHWSLDVIVLSCMVIAPAIVIIIAIRDDHVASYNIVSQNQPPFPVDRVPKLR